MMAALSDFREHIITLVHSSLCNSCGRAMAVRGFDVRFLVGFKNLGFPVNPSPAVICPMCDACLARLENFWSELPVK